MRAYTIHLFVQYRYMYYVCMSYIYLYNTAIHDTRNLYVYNVFVQARYTLIREPHPADPPFRHISMLTYQHKVTCVLGLGSVESTKQR